MRGVGKRGGADARTGREEESKTSPEAGGPERGASVRYASQTKTYSVSMSQIAQYEPRRLRRLFL